ncbi:hypothetical protein CABS01_07220 [Colletotrichum abscissum]|uniref:uncharacterized protein n=1 Tax=Colletotrichum abscissum TaxID=1671311 RepID=UPI0027D60111|nr:uncharacterized protein CABS01_07220 [Colletotrichum abscissum]KAK1513814.1 hypothetical protein CABS01_07220 [Colletotrichum abscissum]
MATPNGTEPPNFGREELESRFNSVMTLSRSEAPRALVQQAAAALLLESGLLSREQSLLHSLLTHVPEGYVEHAEEALRHANLAASTMSIIYPVIGDDAQPLITILEMSLEKARRCKAIVDRAVKEKVVDTQVMMNLFANEDELKLFLKRYIAAMDAAHGPPQTLPADDLLLDGASASDPETSLLFSRLSVRLRFAKEATEAASEDPDPEDAATPENTTPKVQETSGNTPDAAIKPELI